MCCGSGGGGDAGCFDDAMERMETLMKSVRDLFESLECPPLEFHIAECDGGRKIESDDDWERACRTLYGEPVAERCDRCSGQCGTNR